jgi:hypothetical protein
MCSSLLHEPADPVERVEGGVRTRTLSGRVRAGASGLNAYVFALLRARDYLPEPAEGFERVAVSFVPVGSWCRYEATDKATAPARKRPRAPGRLARQAPFVHMARTSEPSG